MPPKTIKSLGHLSKESGKVVEFFKGNLPNITNKIINPKRAWHHKKGEEGLTPSLLATRKMSKTRG